MTTPGWYPDPLGGPGTRYWNGTQWDGVEAAPPEDYPPIESPLREKRNRLLIPALLVIVGLLAGALAVALWPKGEKPAATSPTEAAAASVRASMQHKLDTDPDLSEYGLTVVKVVLVNKSGNEYKGIATVEDAAGDEHGVAIDVTADENDTIWTSSKGAFLFVLDKPPTRAAPKPPDAEDMTICPSGRSAVASEDTSCAFADNVRASWHANPGPVVIAHSPVTGLDYTMRCDSAVTSRWKNAQRCSGKNPYGATLTVYFR